MAIREFTDGRGNRWKVWEVVPASAVPRVIERRRAPREVARRPWLACECESLRERRRTL